MIGSAAAAETGNMFLHSCTLAVAAVAAFPIGVFLLSVQLCDNRYIMNEAMLLFSF